MSSLSLSLAAPAAPARSLQHRTRTTCSVQKPSSRPEPRRLGAAAAVAAATAGRRRSVQASAAAATAADPEVAELKAALLDSFWGTDRGLAASSDARAEINELITQLEARNPTPEPNDARELLSGAWRLAYTSNSELIALLALGRLPLVTVGEVTQTIDPLGQTVENRVELQAPLSKTALSATASFEIRSPKLLQVAFEEGRVATPELTADLQLPSSLDVLGQRVDLAPLQAALQPVEGPLRSALGALGGVLSGLPDLRLPIKQVSPSSWLLNTYLDDSLRITRGDGGSVFVLVKDSYADTGYDYAAAMHSSDWERIEEQEPLHGTAVVPEAVATSDGAAVVEVVEVVETPGNDGVDISSTISPADNGSGHAPRAP